MDETAQLENVSATAGLKDRVYLIMRTLLRSSYFGEALPPLAKLTQMTRIPRSALEDAIARLQTEGMLQLDGEVYNVVPAEVKAERRVAFLLNSNLFAGWYGIFQDYLIGFEEAMRTAGVEVFFRSEFPSVELKAAAIREFQASGYHGIAFASYAEPRLRELVLEHHIPSVVLGNATIQQDDLPSVCSDNIGGMRKIIQLLASNGHKHIAYYSAAAKSHDGFQERLVGYELAMREAGLRPVHDLVCRERHSATLVRRAAATFLAMSPMPTAIACSCDREAFELMAELRQSGLNAPNDVSITGFGNSIFGGISQPPLTSVEIFAREMGGHAATYLLKEMEGTQMPLRLLLPTELVVRESVVGVEIIPATDDTATGAKNAPPSKNTARLELPDEQELYNY